MFQTTLETSEFAKTTLKTSEDAKTTLETSVNHTIVVTTTFIVLLFVCNREYRMFPSSFSSQVIFIEISKNYSFRV